MTATPRIVPGGMVWALLAVFLLPHASVGDLLRAGSTTALVGRELADSVETAMLALCVWLPPALADPARAGIVSGLCVSFALACLLFGIGCDRARALLSFGYAPTIDRTVLAGLRDGWRVAVG